MDDDVVPGTAEFSALDSVRGSLFADKSLSTGFDCVGRWFHAKWLGGKIEVVKKPVGGFLYTDSKREVDLGLQEDGWLEGRTPAGGLLRLRCHRSDILVLQEKECLGCDGWGVEVRLAKTPLGATKLCLSNTTKSVFMSEPGQNAGYVAEGDGDDLLERHVSSSSAARAKSPWRTKGPLGMIPATLGRTISSRSWASSCSSDESPRRKAA
eukprot:TRINITY_DN21991_c0_g1_i2.p1 TRINITY_DN21991_c0_g1~~TRINITY_DN21991_c0_g1_i2.p1  ORF type:complete len:233 (-),score=23.36 TRINITY_DN21991_c0_g1_i2:262-891(-)